MADTSLIIPYTGFSGGEKTLRTIFEPNGDVLVSLEDMVLILATENKHLSEQQGKTGLGKLVQAAAEVLDEDEQRHVTSSDGKRLELFVTQPGMYRIVSMDSSPASKKFQRWLFHEVLPSVHKYGTYPPPIISDDSEVKSLAKALIATSELILKEIEEREKLETRVMERFGVTDKKLKCITERLEAFESIPTEAFEDVEKRCSEVDCDVSADMVSAWCFKICIEKNIETRRSLYPSEKRLFPIQVIDEAITIMRSAGED